MTIAQQIAHDFLASIEKVCVENKIDIGSLETSIIYDKGAQAGIAVKDAQAGIIIASMNYDLDKKSLKRKKKEKELEDYCIEEYVLFAISKNKLLVSLIKFVMKKLLQMRK